MRNERSIGALSELSAASLGVFSGHEAVALGVTRKQLAALKAAGVIERVLPGVYCMLAVGPSAEQRLRAALCWGGTTAVGTGLSAGETYNLDGVHARKPEIVVSGPRCVRSEHVIVHRTDNVAALMAREYRGVRVTGVEATLVALAHALDGETFEVACEDARRRRLTTVPALRAYLDRFGGRGHSGSGAARDLLDRLDPTFPSRSTLEVKTRRLLVANGFRDFEREFPLEWKGKRYLFDFAFRARRTIVEMNGRRWHDDATDYEYDNEKWSVPGYYGFKILLATWEKVTKYPDEFITDLAATLAE